MLVTMTQQSSRSHEIVATILDLAESRGVTGVTTAALARRLGFTEAALYRYFPSKDAILAAALAQTAEELFASMALDLVPAQAGTEGGIEAQLRRHSLRFAARQGVVLELLLAAAESRAGGLQEAGCAFLQEYFHRMAVYFDQSNEFGLTAHESSRRELSSLWICQLLGGFVHARLTRETWDPTVQEGFQGFLSRLAPTPTREPVNP
jgi:AcrR family transcriptional regulator